MAREHSPQPAATIIEKVGGIDKTAEVVGRHRSVINRWLLPKSSGGTAGSIPSHHMTTLLEHARAKGIDLTPADFFPSEAA